MGGAIPFVGLSPELLVAFRELRALFRADFAFASGFDQEAACRTTIQSIEESGASGNHKDVLILYTFDCKTVPSTLSVDLSVYNLDSLYVKLLNDQGQRALELPGKGGELDLKDE